MKLLMLVQKQNIFTLYFSAPKSDDDAPISDTISDATKLSPSAIKKSSKNNYDDSDEYETPLQLTYEPSSLGISFQIRSSKKLKVTTKFARYFEKQDEKDEKNKLWKRKAFEYLNSISFEDKRIFLEEGIYLPFIAILKNRKLIFIQLL